MRHSTVIESALGRNVDEHFAGMQQRAQVHVALPGQRGQASGPLAIVGIDRAVELDQRVAVDVAPDHAVKPLRLRIVETGLHEGFDVMSGDTALALDAFGQQPAMQAEPAARAVEQAADLRHAFEHQPAAATNTAILIAKMISIRGNWRTAPCGND